jgi:TonB family protein
VPGGIDAVTHQLRALLALDNERARRDIAPATLAYWLAVSEPGRVRVSIIAIVLTQIVVAVGAMVGVICAGLRLGVVPWLGITAFISAFGALAWGAVVAVERLRNKWRQRQQNLLDAGRKPRDLLLSVCTFIAGVGLLFSGVQAWFGVGTFGGAPFATAMVGVMGVVLMLSGRSMRLEVGLFLAAMAYFLFTGYVALRGALPADPAALLGAAASVGLLLTVAIEALHAGAEKIRPMEARKETNFYAIILALIVGLGTFVYMPSPAAPPAPLPDQFRLDAGASAKEQAQRQAFLEQISRARAAALGIPVPMPAQRTRSEDEWQAWAASNGYEYGALSRIPNVREAWGFALRADMHEGRTQRAFHYSGGPLAGDWFFSGGGFDGPKRVVHYPLVTDANGAVTADLALCEPHGAACNAFLREARQPASAPGGSAPEGGRFTWDSPGLVPLGSQCPKAELRPDELATLSVASVPVRLLFDPRGAVLEVQVATSSGDPGLDAAATTAAEKCRIEPSLHEGAKVGGVLETAILLR